MGERSNGACLWWGAHPRNHGGLHDETAVPSHGGRTQGLPRVYDYYYHSHAVYVLDTRTGVDRLTVAIPTIEETVRRVATVAYRSASWVLVFLWNPTLLATPPLERFVNSETPLAVVLGLHYHGTDTNGLALLPSVPPNTQCVWVLMACDDGADLPIDVRRFRDARQRALRAELVGRIPTIDPCEKSLTVPRVWDHTHFQCSFTPIIQACDGIQAPAAMKTTTATCTDPYNRWIVRAIWAQFNATPPWTR